MKVTPSSSNRQKSSKSAVMEEEIGLRLKVDANHSQDKSNFLPIKYN